MIVRIMSIVLSVWLFISSFVWTHTEAQFTNTWIVGVVGVAFTLLTMVASNLRYLNTLLSLWLFISVFVLPTTTATGWNNALVAIALFIMSLVGPTDAVVRKPVRTSA